jgi:hypothetical protein
MSSVKDFLGETMMVMADLPLAILQDFFVGYCSFRLVGISLTSQHTQKRFISKGYSSALPSVCLLGGGDERERERKSVVE